MASREPGGDAFTPAPRGRALHPQGHLVIMVLMAFASFTKPAILKYYYLFRQNESHRYSFIVAVEVGVYAPPALLKKGYLTRIWYDSLVVRRTYRNLVSVARIPIL
jgi:hypothetical protein